MSNKKSYKTKKTKICKSKTKNKIKTKRKYNKKKLKLTKRRRKHFLTKKCKQKGGEIPHINQTISDIKKIPIGEIADVAASAAASVAATVPIKSAITSDTTGDVTGATTGAVTGATTGAVTGATTGATTGTVTGAINDAITGTMTSAIDVISAPINIAKKAASDAITVAEDIVSAPINIVKEVVSTPVTAVESAISTPVTAVESAISAPITAVESAISIPEAIVKNIFSSVSPELNSEGIMTEIIDKVVRIITLYPNDPEEAAHETVRVIMNYISPKHFERYIHIISLDFRKVIIPMINKIGKMDENDLDEGGEAVVNSIINLIERNWNLFSGIILIFFKHLRGRMNPLMSRKEYQNFQFQLIDEFNYAIIVFLLNPDDFTKYEEKRKLAKRLIEAIKNSFMGAAYMNMQYQLVDFINDSEERLRQIGIGAIPFEIGEIINVGYAGYNTISDLWHNYEVVSKFLKPLLLLFTKDNASLKYLPRQSQQLLKA